MRIDSSDLQTAVRSIKQPDMSRALAQLRAEQMRLDITSIGASNAVQSIARISLSESLPVEGDLESVVELPVLSALADHGDSVAVSSGSDFAAGSHRYRAARDDDLNVGGTISLPDPAAAISAQAGDLVQLIEQVNAPRVKFVTSSAGDLEMIPSSPQCYPEIVRGPVQVPDEHTTVLELSCGLETEVNPDYLTRCLRSLAHGSETTMHVGHEHPMVIVAPVTDAVEIRHTIAPMIPPGGDD